jgi:Phytanoyl-CoA dioxygenase (PhyH)
MLTTEQREHFDTWGFVCLPGAFAKDAAQAMEARVWRWLEKRHGARRDDPTSWSEGAVYGLQGMKRDAVFDEIGSDALRAALDDLVGAGRWQRPRDWGGFLVTFPSAGPWCVPSRVWHTDFDFRGPAAPPRGALVFSFLSDVPPGAGGTLAVAGSQRLIAQFVASRPSAGREKMKITRTAFLASDPWLRELSGEPHAEDRTQRLTQPSLVGGVPVRVVELSGEAGDAVIGHPWLLHNGSLNCGAVPRLMRVARIRLSAPAISVASVM